MVAVLWQTLLARSLHVRLDRWEPAVLVVCVWLVYICDRLLDVTRVPRRQWEPVRKVFYRRNPKLAAAVAICLLVFAVFGSILLLSPRVIRGGIALSVCVLIYLASIHLAPAHWRTRWPRELAVAAFFTAGSFLAIAVAPGVKISNVALPSLLFGLLAWANICAIEDYESRRNVAGVNVVVHRSTSLLSNHLTFDGLAIAMGAGILGSFAAIPREFAMTALLSGIALALSAYFRERMPADFVPAAADLALCTPVLVLVFNAWN